MHCSYCNACFVDTQDFLGYLDQWKLVYGRVWYHDCRFSCYWKDGMTKTPYHKARIDKPVLGRYETFLVGMSKDLRHFKRVVKCIKKSRERIAR